MNVFTRAETIKSRGYATDSKGEAIELHPGAAMNRAKSAMLCEQDNPPTRATVEAIRLMHQSDMLKARPLKFTDAFPVRGFRAGNVDRKCYVTRPANRSWANRYVPILPDEMTTIGRKSKAPAEKHYASSHTVAQVDAQTDAQRMGLKSIHVD